MSAEFETVPVLSGMRDRITMPEPPHKDQVILWATDADHEDVREFCTDLLRAADVEDLGGCPLCQG